MRGDVGRMLVTREDIVPQVVRNSAVTKISDSMLGENAESPPQERSKYPGSHADLAA